MKRIKVRAKHIVLIMLTVAVLIFVVLPYGMLSAAKHFKEKDPETAKVIYKRYLNVFPYKNAYVLYKLAEVIAPIDDNNFIVKFSSNMRSGGTNVTKEMTDNACAYYKRVVDDYKDSEYYEKAYNNLLYLYTSNLKLDEGNRLIDEGFKSENINVYKRALQYKMFYLACDNKFSEAKNIANNFLKNKDDRDIYTSLGDICIMQKNFKDADRYYKKALSIEDTSLIINRDPFYFKIREDYLENSKELTNRFINYYNGSGTIKGKVSKDNKPIPFARIILKNKLFDSFSTSVDEGDYIFTFTDYKGEYSFENLPDETYLVQLLIPSTLIEDSVLQGSKSKYAIINKKNNKQVLCDFSFVKPFKVLSPMGKAKPENGKVKIEWEKVYGASYYNVVLTVSDNPTKLEGSSSSVPINKDDIMDTKYTIDIDKVNPMHFGCSIDDKGIKNPSTYLGVFFNESKTPFHVEAYDQNRRLIGSSVPTIINMKNMSYISMENYRIDDGENLILNGKIDEASKYYKEKLKKNSKDINALRILSNIYLHGTRADLKNRDNPPVGYDFEKYVDCIKKLYSYTNNTEYIHQALNPYFDKNVDKKKYSNMLIELYKLMPQNKIITSDYDNMAEIYINKDEYSSAKEYFDKKLLLSSKTDFNMSSVVLNIYMDDFKIAYLNMNSTNSDLVEINMDVLKNGTAKVEKLNKTTTEYVNFKKCLKTILDRDKKEFLKTYKSINNKEMRNVLKELGKYYSFL